MYSFAPGELLESQLIHRMLKKTVPAKITSCRYMTGAIRNGLQEYLENRDLDPDALNAGCYSEELSFFTDDENGDHGVLLAQQNDKDIIVTMLYCVSKDHLTAVGLLAEFFKK